MAAWVGALRLRFACGGWSIAGVCACYFSYRWILPRLWLLAFCCVFVGVMF